MGSGIFKFIFTYLDFEIVLGKFLGLFGGL